MINTEKFFEEMLKLSAKPSGGEAVATDMSWDQLTDGLKAQCRMMIGPRGVVWLEGGECPYKQSKPFSIESIGITQDGFLIGIIGQKTDRIREKWEDRFSKIMNEPVKLHWLEEMKRYNSVQEVLP